MYKNALKKTHKIALSSKKSIYGPRGWLYNLQHAALSQRDTAREKCDGPSSPLVGHLVLHAVHLFDRLSVRLPVCPIPAVTSRMKSSVKITVDTKAGGQ